MKKQVKYFYVALFFLMANFVFSQNRTIDSLKLALKNAKQDTLRLKIKFEIGTQMGIQRLGYWDSLYLEAKALKKTKLETSALNLMASFYSISGNYLKCIELLENSLRISELTGDKHGIAEASNNLATINFYLGNIDLQLKYYLKSYELYFEIGDDNGCAIVLGSIGSYYKNQGNIPLSLDYYNRSLKIFERSGFKDGAASITVKIGDIHEGLGDLDKALGLFRKSLVIRRKDDNKPKIAESLNRIGIIYKKRNNLAAALEIYNEGLSMTQSIGYKKGVAVFLNNIGETYLLMGDKKKGVEYLEKGLRICKEASFKDGIANAFLSLAKIYLENGNTNTALAYADSAAEIFNASAYPANIRNVSNVKKLIYKKQNKYKEAFEMYELEIKMRDSINNTETQKAAVKKEMQYAYEKKELEAKAEQEKKDIVAKEKLKQKEKERNYFIAGFALVIVLALFIFRGYRQKQKANELIAEQKHLVEEKQKEIIDSIHYAQRIQRALITPEKYIDKKLKELQG